jgi:hypothetical protein
LAAPMSLQYHRDVQIVLQAAEPDKCIGYRRAHV